MRVLPQREGRHLQKDDDCREQMLAIQGAGRRSGDDSSRDIKAWSAAAESALRPLLGEWAKRLLPQIAKELDAITDQRKTGEPEGNEGRCTLQTRKVPPQSVNLS